MSASSLLARQIAGKMVKRTSHGCRFQVQIQIRGGDWFRASAVAVAAAEVEAEAEVGAEADAESEDEAESEAERCRRSRQFISIFYLHITLSTASRSERLFTRALGRA